MLPSSRSPGRVLPALGAAVPLIIIMISVLSLPLTAAQQIGLSEAQTANWILALYGIPSLLGIVLAFRYRQPILFTGNIFVLIFIVSLGSQLGYGELVGATIVAGGLVALGGALRLTDRLAAWLPPPIVFGLLAGAILPFVSAIFTHLGEAPVLVGGTFLAYLLGRRFLAARLPAILPAVAAGLALAAFTAQFGQAPARLVLPPSALTWPVFSLRAIATATPVIVVLMTVQANLPSVIFLRNQGYQPPDRMINIVSGVGTALSSLLGPTAVSLSLPATSLAAGPEAGDPPRRHHSVYLSSGAAVLVALLATIAAELGALIPAALLAALAGLAVFAVLVTALPQITKGPLVLGPAFAFAISLSRISLFGFGSFFWALVLGAGISLLLEREAWKRLMAEGNK